MERINSTGQTLLVVIMPIGGNDIYMNFCFKDTINQTVFLGYLSTPTIFGFTFQWLGMACASFGMKTSSLINFVAFLKMEGSLRFSLARSPSASGEKVIVYIITKH